MARFRFYLRKPVRMSASKTLVDKTEKAGYGPIWLIDCRSVGTYGICGDTPGAVSFLPEIRRGDAIANGIPHGVCRRRYCPRCPDSHPSGHSRGRSRRFCGFSSMFCPHCRAVAEPDCLPAENCHPLHRPHRRCPPRRSRNRLRGYSRSPGR